MVNSHTTSDPASGIMLQCNSLTHERLKAMNLPGIHTRTWQAQDRDLFS
jgi:hypothetical protein